MMEGGEVRAVIFDCFGVLVTDTLVAFRNKYFNDQPELDREINDMTRAVDLGYLSKREFHQRIGEMNVMDSSEIFHILEGGSSLDESMLNLVRKLKGNYRIGMLSNISPRRLDDFFSAENKELFDALTLSYDIGFAKPDEQAYRVALAQLDVLAEEAVFIDDQLRNIEAAQNIGMHAVHFTGQANLRHELEKYAIRL